MTLPMLALVKPFAGSIPVSLVINGLGHVPSKKNSKMITPDGLITKPEYQVTIKRIIQSFASQCSSGTAICGGAIPTAPSLRFSIASLPPDDCWTVVPVTITVAEKCKPGEEGATVIIERIA